MKPNPLLFLCYLLPGLCFSICPDYSKVLDLIANTEERIAKLRNPMTWPEAFYNYPEILESAITEGNLHLNKAKTFLKLALLYRKNYDKVDDYLDKEYFGKKMDFYFENYQTHLEKIRVLVLNLEKKVRLIGQKKKPSDEVAVGQPISGQQASGQPNSGKTLEEPVENRELVQEMPLNGESTIDVVALKRQIAVLNISDGDTLFDKNDQELGIFKAEDVRKIVGLIRSGETNEARRIFEPLTMRVQQTVIGQKFCYQKMQRLINVLSAAQKEQEYVDAMMKIGELFDSGKYLKANELLGKVFISVGE